MTRRQEVSNTRLSLMRAALHEDNRPKTQQSFNREYNIPATGWPYGAQVQLKVQCGVWQPLHAYTRKHKPTTRKTATKDCDLAMPGSDFFSSGLDSFVAEES